MKMQKLVDTLKANGFIVSFFSAKEEAAAYLDAHLDGMRIGYGGSMSIREMGLADMLKSHNILFNHDGISDAQEKKRMMRAQLTDTEIFITGVNALAETGELVNIDMCGNRVASTLYGHKHVFFIVGKNKIVPTYDDAVYRARNIAAPKNAKRLGKDTPCAKLGDKCYNCSSNDRICNCLVTIWRCMSGTDMEVLLIDEDLGF